MCATVIQTDFSGLVRDSEAVLGGLESLWSNVFLQVGWKLEDCTKPSDDNSEMDAGANANQTENGQANLNEESNSALKGSNSSNSPANTTLECLMLQLASFKYGTFKTLIFTNLWSYCVWFQV